jgi:hypothetical protein
MINARAETVAEKPAYRRAFRGQRALIPVDAFYEWLETDQVGKSDKKLKQPFALPAGRRQHAGAGRAVRVLEGQVAAGRRPERLGPDVHDHHHHRD